MARRAAGPKEKNMNANTNTQQPQRSGGRPPARPNVQFADGLGAPSRPQSAPPKPPQQPEAKAEPKTEPIAVVKQEPKPDAQDGALNRAVNDTVKAALAEPKPETKAEPAPPAKTEPKKEAKVAAPKKESQQQLKNRLRNEAEREILSLPENKKKFYELATKKFEAHGLVFERRLTDEEKAEKEIAEKLAKYPSLRERFAAAK